jgi:hypothetical protein
MIAPFARVALVALAAWFAFPAHAQETFGGRMAQGTSYFVFAEVGAPSFEMFVVGEGVRNGIYRLEEGTTLTELMALSGGVPTSRDDERQIVRALLRVLREQGGVRVPVYEATTEQALREPSQNPNLQAGDVLEFDLTYEEVKSPITVWKVLETTSRIASVVTTVILLYRRAN